MSELKPKKLHIRCIAYAILSYILVYLSVSFCVGIFYMIEGFQTKSLPNESDVYQFVDNFHPIIVNFSIILLTLLASSHIAYKFKETHPIKVGVLFCLYFSVISAIGQPLNIEFFLIGLSALVTSIIGAFLGNTYANRFKHSSNTTDNLNKNVILDKLSPRENDIVNYVKQGYTNKEISNLLFIEESTVKQHLKSIFKKLDVRNRVELSQKCK